MWRSHGVLALDMGGESGIPDLVSAVRLAPGSPFWLCYRPAIPSHRSPISTFTSLASSIPSPTGPAISSFPRPSWPDPSLPSETTTGARASLGGWGRRRGSARAWLGVVEFQIQCYSVVTQMSSCTSEACAGEGWTFLPSSLPLRPQKGVTWETCFLWCRNTDNWVVFLLVGSVLNENRVDFFVSKHADAGLYLLGLL